MPFDTEFLTRKAGPLPVWAYAVGAGALIALVALYRRGQSQLASTQPGIPASPYASSDQGLLNYPPTVVVTPAGMTNSVPITTTPAGTNASTSSASLAFHFGPAQGTNWVWRLTPIGEQAFQKLFGGPWVGGVHPSSEPLPTGLPQYAWEVAELPAGVSWQQVAGQGGGGEDTGMGGGFGAGTIQTRPVTGSRRWDYFTPFQPQQFVAAGMGAGPHSGGVAAVSRATGVAAARLKSLNYHLRRSGGRYGPGIVRVA